TPVHAQAKEHLFLHLFLKCQFNNLLDRRTFFLHCLDVMVHRLYIVISFSADISVTTRSETEVFIILPISLIVCRFIFPLRSEEHTSELQSRFDLVCR